MCDGQATFETTLDPTTEPFLHDHQIEGTPVLPGVMGIEAFAEAARWMASRTGTWRRSKMSISWRRSSSIATSPAHS